VTVRRRAGPVAAALAIVVLFALPAVPGASGPSPLAPPSAVPVATAAGPAALGPHPLVTCPNTNPPTPAYEYVGLLLPPTPALHYQGPCNLVDEDEAHATFSSAQAYSGSRFTVPLWLPPDSPTVTQSTMFYEILLGMVVSGNSSSAWGQSYAEVTFTPDGTGNWSEALAVWSMENDSVWGGFPSESNWACPSNSMPLSWNNSYFCVVQMLTDPGPFAQVPGGEFLNVTFAGTPGGTAGLTVWSNDSTNSSNSFTYTFDAASTGTDTFEPFYNASCADNCLLNWAFPYGNGFGAFPETYSEPMFRALPPITFGVPRFWNGTGYGGEYSLFVPESTSGACNTVAPPATVAPCFDFSMGLGTGYYPFFSFNGSQMNFGADWPWTSIRMGGAQGEYLGTGGQNDLTPLWFLSRSNSSLAGFSPPNVAIYINATVQALGTVTGVSYRYQLNGGAYTSGSLTAIGGTATNRSYSGMLPSSLGNGVINFTLTATDHAGSSLLDPPFTTYRIQRGPLPTFTVDVHTNGGSCARVRINGTDYADGGTFVTHPGYFPAYAVGCYPWNFTQWVPTGGTGISPSLYERAGTLEVFGNGSISTAWAYVRPYDTINITTSPTTCGQVVLDGMGYTNGQSVQLLDGLSHTLGNGACANELFAGYTFQGNFTVLGPSFIPDGNGTLTANFVPQSQAVSIQFFTEPSTCGGVLYRGAGYTNGESLSVLPGTYPIAPGPCAHFGFLEWQSSGGATTSGNNTTITAAGSITEVNYHLTEITFRVDPSSCGQVTFDDVPFSDGAVLSVANNSTHTVYPVNQTGCYLIALTATGGITLEGNVAIVNGSGEIDVSFGIGTPADTIAFLTAPATCGSIWFNNQPYYNANFTNVAPGLVVTITAKACAGYGFVRWLTYGPIAIVGSTAWLNGSGAIEAIFQPLVQLFFTTEPSGCGSIVLDGQSFTTNSTAEFAMLASYPLAAVPCAGYRLSHWDNSSDLELSPGTIFIGGSGVLTAVFVPILYAVRVRIDPATCGAILVNGVHTTDNTTLDLAAGTYSVSPQPCLGSHLDHWVVEGNLTVTGASLVVSGPGNLTAVVRPVPPVVALSLPTSTLIGEEVQVFATVAEPVPPFNYTYTWTFGDGSAPVTTPANFTGHTFHATGTYTVTVSVHDPYGRVANATGRISALTGSGTQALGLSGLQIAVFAGLGVALVALVAIAVQRGRAARSAAPPEEPGTIGAPDTLPETERNHDK
jgi:PKD domain